MALFRTASFVALFLVLAGPSTAQFLLDVPGDFDTIQEAVDAADFQDTVRIGAGTFAGFSVVDRAEIEIVGQKGHRIEGDILVENSTVVELRKLRVEGSITVTDSNVIDVLRCRVFGGGIDIQNSGSLIVERNRVEDAPVGISVVGTDFQLHRNLIFRPGDLGIRVAGPGEIKGNKIAEGAPGGSISVAGDGPVKVVRNQIVKAEGAGIVVEGELHRIERNEVLGGRGAGILCREGGFHRFVGNLLKRVEDGIHIDASCPGNDLVGNTVKKVRSTGIHVESDANEVNGNLVAGLEGVGIEVSGTDNTVRGNAVFEADSDGFQCTSGTANRFENNTAKRVGQDGFDIEADCTGNQIVDNTIRGAGSDGIDVEGFSNEVTGNRISAADDSGIELSGSANTVSGNTIGKVGGEEISEEAEGNFVRGNSCPNDPDACS